MTQNKKNLSFLASKKIQRVAQGSGVILAGLLLAGPALAHHGMDRQMPTTFFEGFISGLAHPIIGLDHFAFVVAMGLLAATKPKGLVIPIAFVLAAMAGTGLHLSSVNLPMPELFIAGSVLVVGLGLALGSRLSTGGLVGLVGLAGLFHGYAYGEAIIGAETTPLVAYLLGFTAIQLAVSVAVFWAASRDRLASPQGSLRLPKLNIQSSGWAIAGIGVAFVYAQAMG